MRKNDLLQWNNTIIRILSIEDTRVLAIDCIKRTMPQWINTDILTDCKPYEESQLEIRAGIQLDDFEKMNIKEKRTAHERYTSIIVVFWVGQILLRLLELPAVENHLPSAEQFR